MVPLGSTGTTLPCSLEFEQALEATPAVAQIVTVEEKTDGCDHCIQTYLAVVLFSASW